MPTIDLTAAAIGAARVPEGKEREFFWDSTLPGFGLMVTAAGARSWVVQYRAHGNSRRMSIPGGKPLAAAKKEAKVILGAVAKGGDPLAEKRKARDSRANTLKAIANEYLADPDVKKLRSLHEKKGTFNRYIFPSLGARPIAEIKRSDIVRMLARVKANNGPAAANNTFKVLSRFLNWYAARDDNFRSPIVRGTYSQTKGDGARTLTDDELRIIWKVSGEATGPYDHLVRFILLTATRLNESAEMPRDELSPDGSEWTIPQARYKGEDGKSAHAHLIPLSMLARETLAAVPVVNNGFIVFTTNGKTPVSGFSKFKKSFDKRLFDALEQEGDETWKRIVADLNSRYPGKGYLPFGKEWYDAKPADRAKQNPWSTHSLRKTARTLLDRLGVSESVAEKCLGHIRSGIVGTYNHHEAKEEKRAAFEDLAAEILRISHGEPN